MRALVHSRTELMGHDAPRGARFSGDDSRRAVTSIGNPPRSLRGVGLRPAMPAFMPAFFLSNSSLRRGGFLESVLRRVSTRRAGYPQAEARGGTLI